MGLYHLYVPLMCALCVLCVYECLWVWICFVQMCACLYMSV